MKRLYALILAILFCTLAFSQHPYSRGGNPFYWALVGGISAGMLYVFYLLFGLLVNMIKRFKRKDFGISGIFHSVFSKIDNDEKVSESKTCGNLQVNREEQHVINDEENHQDTTLCKQCGKQISTVALYCSYCGASQSRTPSTLRKLSQKLKDSTFLNALVKKFVRFILVLALLALFGGIFAFICNEIGGNDENQGICVFSPIAAYLLYRLLHYAYKFSRKKKQLIITMLVLLVSASWGLCIADSIRSHSLRQAEAQRIVEMHRVNRSFLGCSFGDDASKVSETLRKYIPNNLLPPTRLSGNGIDKIWLENIQYGDYTLNSISFMFYRDKLYKVVMDVQTSENESYSDLWTYNHLSTMLSKKYEEDSDAQQYKNTENYCDYHTAVQLWHATYGMGDYKVTLTYYDKDSGYKEHQEEGF